MASRKKRRSSSRSAPKSKRKAWLVPLLAGLLVIAVIALLAALALRFEQALSEAEARGGTPVGLRTTQPTRTAAPVPAATGAAPGGVATGRWVVVTGTGSSQLRVRQAANASAPTVKTVPDGTRLLVTDGPVQAGGLTWWKVEDQRGLVGWAAGTYLETLP